MSHYRSNVAHFRVTIGHHRVTLGHFKDIEGHFRVTIGHYRITIGHLFLFPLFRFLSFSKHKANTTELHPKVKPTCNLMFLVSKLFSY